MTGRSWVRLDVGYLTHPRMAPLSDKAVLLHLALVCYCAEHLTDGFVPSTIAARSLSDRIPIGSRSRIRRRLIDAGLLTECEGGYMVRDFLQRNPHLERAHVERERARWRSYKSGGAA